MAVCPSELGCASWEAFGTSIVLRLTSPRALSMARSCVEQELDAIDRACSRFRADSELSRINAADGRRTRVGDLLMEALELSLSAAELTSGDVDPTVGRALELAGYDRDWKLLKPSEPLPEGSHAQHRQPSRSAGAIRACTHSGWQTVTLDRRNTSVRLPRGIRLDLGATAKAWAADRAARAAAATAGCGALVSIGGDISTCGQAPPDGWHIRVTDDHRNQPGAPGQTVSIRSGGLATSSTTVRRWHHNGQDMHHIIDPRTGAPVQVVWRTVSVAAASCAEANIATTAALVRGPAAAAWLTELGLPARLVALDGHAVALGDWPVER